MSEETATVLVVDDDPAVLRVICRTLEREGFVSSCAGSAEAALEWVARRGLPHLAVIDIRLPGLDGIELCRRLRQEHDVPVVLVSGIGETDTVVQAIDEVADDYIVKPVRPAELAARVKRVMRRVPRFDHTGSGPARVDRWLELDLPLRRVRAGAAEVDLTPAESRFLELLVESSPRVVPEHVIRDRLWPLGDGSESSIRVLLHRLRRKIEPDPHRPRYLLTHRGLGYQFRPAREAAGTR